MRDASGATITTETGTKYWTHPVNEVLGDVGSSPDGLSAAEADARLAANGPNALAGDSRSRGLRLLISQFTTPIVLILIGATVLSFVLGDATDSAIILAIVLASGLLGFWQEHSAGRTIDALIAQVRATARVRRDGAEIEIPTADVVVGDVLVLLPGTVIAADGRVLASDGLLLDQSALTGESYPTFKHTEPDPADTSLGERRAAVFMGTHVLSGTGSAVVVRTGASTEFGKVSGHLGSRAATTSFERGATAFGMLLVRWMVVLVTGVFIVNLVLHRPIIDSLLFSLALAVGLTPQLLPAIVAISLAKGAKRMADEQVIVKRLDAIEDFGSMTMLCTDKTGTITEGAVHLEAALDLDGVADTDVFRLAYLNASLQRGFPNPLDLAITGETAPEAGATLIDEVPYDFARKRLSVLVDDAGTPVLITKGAFSSVVGVCERARSGEDIVDIATVRVALEQRFEEMSSQGLRVLGIAMRELPGATGATAADETGMVLRGLLTFADPSKPTARAAIDDLAGLGVLVSLITGDNRLAARHTATAVGLPTDTILTGEDVERLTDEELPAALVSVRVFAEVEPLHKERIVRALRASGQTVGFLGDGINDASALHAADIGISVDTAVDVAKQTAAIVLMDKSLDVVADGIRLGRQTFANTLKYVRVTISANFGNVLSMAAASAFLPFLPLLPRQILLLNFLSDMPATTISTDAVDEEQTVCPEVWDIRGVRTFMIGFGLLSSVFDMLTFLSLRVLFHAPEALFRSAWFIESTVTELVAMLVLRTGRRFWRSKPSTALMLSSLAVFVVTVALPFSPLAKSLGLTGVGVPVLGVLAALTVLYVLGNEVLKAWLARTEAESSRRAK